MTDRSSDIELKSLIKRIRSGSVDAECDLRELVSSLQPASPTASAADLLKLLVQAGYNPNVVHPDCYLNFSYAKLADLLAAPASDAVAGDAKVTGARNQVEEAACLIWSELCPGMVMGDDDLPHYEAAAKAVLALRSDAAGGDLTPDQIAYCHERADVRRQSWAAHAAGGVTSGAATPSDPTASAEWNNGCDFAMEQLCKFLDVDTTQVSWDAATETVDGDVQAVIGNILRAKFGEDWGPDAVAQAVPVPALIEFFKWAMREGPWDGGDLDGGSVQDKAESLGLIVKTQYDAEKHGVQSDFEHGDDWFVLAPSIGLPSTHGTPSDRQFNADLADDAAMTQSETGK